MTLLNQVVSLPKAKKYSQKYRYVKSYFSQRKGTAARNVQIIRILTKKPLIFWLSTQRKVEDVPPLHS